MKAPGKLLLSKLFRNCAEPRGALGRLMLRMMNRGHRRVYAWTFDHCPLADGMRTLDVGCGGGGAILELVRRFPAIRADGVDVSEESVAMCRRRVAAADIANPGEIVRGEAGSLPMAEATYDAAYAIETVYFWPDLIAGLREMLRVLKPGGAAAVAVECFDPEAARPWKALVGRMEVRTPEQLAAAFREAGFADVAFFRQGAERPAWCGSVCIVGRKPAGGAA
jgi:ubiquinone/menaquinone biosynthesis C-methylase UbiE